MSTQQDIYVAGFQNRPPMLNKENYVSWSSRLLCYAKSKPNGMLIYNSITKGPYVRRMNPEPGDPDRDVPVAETFHDKECRELGCSKYSLESGCLECWKSNGLIVVPGIANPNVNQHGNGNVVAARAEGNGNGNNGNQIRCYNCRGLGHLARNCTVRPRRRDVAYLQTQLLIAQKEEA
ncbi:retrovirus-related pol polyprotein from transposon TNT 1-94 [Tanacetum coccineum]